MKNITLKCWNGIYGCCSFEVLDWQYDGSLDKAGQYYKNIWNYCWAEDENGNIIKRF